MAKEILEVDIRVEDVSKFKSDLNQARVALNKLQSKELETGGASDVLKKKISAQRIEVRRLRLAHEGAALALKQHEVQALRTGAATNKLTKGQKRSRQAMTQVAYAMDDMQYGFQGVQNNIQAMAVSMGAGGPLIIGITAVVAGIGFMVNAFKKSQKEATKLKEELGEKQGLMAEMMTLVEVVKQNKKGTEAYEEAMKKLRQNGFRGAKKDLDDYIKRLRLLMIVEAQIAAKQGKMKTLAVDREEAIQTMKDLDKIAGNIGIGEDNKLISGKVEGGTGFLSAANVRKYNAALKAVADTTKEMGEIAKETGKLQADLFNDEITKNKNESPSGKDNDKGKPLDVNKLQSDYYKSINKDIKQTLELMRAQGDSKEELLAKEMEMLDAANFGRLSLEDQEGVLHRIAVIKAEIANIPGAELLKDGGIGLTPDDELFEKFKSDLAIIRQLFDEGTISFDEWMRRVDNLTASFQKVDEATSATTENTQMFAQAFIGAFESAATQGGAFMENLARGLMSSLGSILIQQGTAAIFSGIAKNGITPGSGTASIASGKMVVGAGIALKAGSSIGKRSGGAGGGGGGSSSGSKSGPSSEVRPSNPVRENARVRNSNLIIPMDMMRYGMQNANDNYSGFN
jgi:hypothetical protein